MPTVIISHVRRSNRRQRCGTCEISTMRTMRFNGYTLSEIAKMHDRSVPTVWKHTLDVRPAKGGTWGKDRVITRTGMCATVKNGYDYITLAKAW